MSRSSRTAAPAAPATPPLFSFTARSDDPAVELFLIDARMQLVARGRDELTTLQPLGVYTLKLRAGPSSREEVILLDRNMIHQVAPLRFSSAVPLNSTSETHENHQAAAEQHSDEINVRLGSGSSIFVFAREWTPDSQTVKSGHHPAEGLTLASEAGETLVDFQKQSVVNLQGDPWAACRVSLRPGTYRLAVRVATGEHFEMTLPALPGYFTKVFLLQREEQGSGQGRRPDLARASVLLSRDPIFRKDFEENRIAEMARLALADRRRVYGTVLNQLLTSKWENPMLGILGGHLLLLEENVDTGLLRNVVENLRAILPVPQPDVEALALAAGLGTNYRFRMPPMLRASWQIVLDHSVRQPGLVPLGSLAASLAFLVTHQDPWLIWCRPGTQRQLEQQQRSFADIIRKQLQPTLARSMTNMVLRKVKTGVPAVDKLIGQLNLPPATVAHLAGKFLRSAAPGSTPASPKPPAPAKAAARKQASAQAPKKTVKKAAKKK